MNAQLSSAGSYSLRRDFRQSLWLVVTGVATVYSRVLLEKYPLVGPGWQWLLALSPFLPLLLHVRAVRRAIKGMDELQRRLQVEAWLFGAFGALLVATAITTLHDFGLMQPLFQPGLGLPGACVITSLLFLLGSFLARRRYQ